MTAERWDFHFDDAIAPCIKVYSAYGDHLDFVRAVRREDGGVTVRRLVTAAGKIVIGHDDVIEYVTHIPGGYIRYSGPGAE